MAVVLYRFEHEGTDATDVSVIITEYFRRARWPRPTNLSATANHCGGKGWLSEVGQVEGRKLWRITRKGYDSIKTRIGHTNREEELSHA
jgi:hypothetical protein